MKRRLALVATVSSLCFGSAAVAPAPVALSDAAYAKPCGSHWVHAALSWGHKCLGEGQFCKVTGDREYHRYGFHCHTGRLRR